MRRASAAALLLLALACLGCERDCFEIEVAPRGDGFQRKLTCWHEKSDKESERTALSQAQLECLAKLYDSRETPDGAAKQTFSGRFSVVTPADVGGAGSLKYFESPFGSCSIYVERFRGSDDLEAELAKRRRAADQLTDLLLGWLQAELGDQPGFDRLRRFVDRDFRRDLTNLGLHVWSADVATRYQPKSGEEFVVRVWQYLVERGYFAPKDMPVLVRAVSHNQPGQLLKLIQRLVARKMGVADGDPVPGRLAILIDPERLKVSWTKYIEGTEPFKARLANWEREKRADPNAERPTAEDLLEELAGEALFKFELFARPDSLKLRLICRTEPFMTNGKWEEEAGAVTWSTNLDEHPSLPVVCFAAWSQPNAGAQTKRFGRLVLTGRSLAEYVLWYRSLSDAEHAAWDEFISGLKPGGELKPAVESFRFTGDPQPDQANPDHKPASLADTPRRLILKGLEPNK